MTTRQHGGRAGQGGVPPGAFLQRACSCGGSPGPTGECPACRRKRKLRVQRKLRVGAPGDRWEREADSIVRQTLGREAAESVRVTPLRSSGPSGSGMELPVPNRGIGWASGRALPPGPRREMEARFGHDFGTVRIHTGREAVTAADALGARAFTVGRDVAFAAGEYRPGTPGGRSLLAHELVHTLQQGGAGGPGSEGIVQRQPVPSPDAPATAAGPPTPEQAAVRAELTCDLPTLCQLRFSHPEVVSGSRVRRAVSACRPGVVVGPVPCLDPTLMGSRVPGPSGGPGPASLPPSAGAPARAGGGLPDFGDLLTFELRTGDATVSVKLPSEARFRLPVDFGGATRITFELVAKASGSFAFSITLDGIPHVQIKSTTTADVASETLKSELKISSAMKTCHAPGRQATTESLKKAGGKLKKAIDEVNRFPDAAASPPDSFDRAKRVADVVKEIVAVKKAVDKAKEGCKPTPTISFGITAQTPFDPSAEDALPGSVTGGLTVHF